MAQYTLSNVEDNQITRRFFMCKWNIPKVISTITIEPLCRNPSVRDFAIVRKTPAHFGINLIAADWGKRTS